MQCEKDVLLLIKGCHHLVNIQGYFRDKYYIYFLLDFIKGMELFDVIRIMGRQLVTRFAGQRAEQVLCRLHHPCS